MDEKLKSENMQKTVFYVYVIFREQSGQAGVENGADIFHSAPFRSQIFTIFHTVYTVIYTLHSNTFIDLAEQDPNAGNSRVARNSQEKRVDEILLPPLTTSISCRR